MRSWCLSTYTMTTWDLFFATKQHCFFRTFQLPHLHLWHFLQPLSSQRVEDVPQSIVLYCIPRCLCCPLNKWPIRVGGSSTSRTSTTPTPTTTITAATTTTTTNIPWCLLLQARSVLIEKMYSRYHTSPHCIYAIYCKIHQPGFSV